MSVDDYRNEDERFRRDLHELPRTRALASIEQWLRENTAGLTKRQRGLWRIRNSAIRRLREFPQLGMTDAAITAWVDGFLGLKSGDRADA